MTRRHESLIQLSQDHHNGLMLALQLRDQTRTILPHWPGNTQEQASFVVEFFRAHLAPHFEAEEKSLFPLILEDLPAARAQIDDLVTEHRTMERFFREFGKPDPTSLKIRFLEFGSILESHIRKEERELFPLFEQQGSPEALARARELLLRHYPGKPE